MECVTDFWCPFHDGLLYRRERVVLEVRWTVYRHLICAFSALCALARLLGICHITVQEEFADPGHWLATPGARDHCSLVHLAFLQSSAKFMFGKVLCDSIQTYSPIGGYSPMYFRDLARVDSFMTTEQLRCDRGI